LRGVLRDDNGSAFDRLGARRHDFFDNSLFRLVLSSRSFSSASRAATLLRRAFGARDEGIGGADLSASAPPISPRVSRGIGGRGNTRTGSFLSEKNDGQVSHGRCKNLLIIEFGRDDIGGFRENKLLRLRCNRDLTWSVFLPASAFSLVSAGGLGLSYRSLATRAIANEKPALGVATVCENNILFGRQVFDRFGD
jgi:hypothetical protein